MRNKENNSGNYLESILRYKVYKDNIINRIALIKEKIYGINVQRSKQINKLSQKSRYKRK